MWPSLPASKNRAARVSPIVDLTLMRASHNALTCSEPFSINALKSRSERAKAYVILPVEGLTLSGHSVPVASINLANLLLDIKSSMLAPDALIAASLAPTSLSNSA